MPLEGFRQACRRLGKPVELPCLMIGTMPTTSELADILLETAPEHDGWSLVESRNTAGHFDDLLDWARGMTQDRWELDAAIRRPQLGLVLLWLESEVARRSAGEGTLWPILANRELVPWSPPVHAELFTGDGAATATHRGLLEVTARHFGLRHTFDEEEGQHWYRLLYLQFGFTHDDAVQRLAPWLSGQLLPVSVQRLLEASDPGALAFQHMWHSLRMFRLGNLSGAVLEARLRSNTWVLPEWCSELIRSATLSNAQIREMADIEAAEVRFFTSPRLGITGDGVPYFATSLCNLSELTLDSEEYHFNAGEQTLARLIRQPSGDYYSDAPEAIRLPLQPSVALSMVGSDGRIAQHDEVILWDMQEEVSVFSPKTGLNFPPGQKLREGAEVYLIASADVNFTPAPAESFTLGLGYMLHRIESGWNGALEGRLDHEVIWSSETVVAASTGDSAEVSAAFADTLDLREDMWRDSDPPWSLPIRINIPEGWLFCRLRWRRGDGRLVELNQLPTHLTLTEQDAIRPLVLKIRISNGLHYQTRVLRVPVPFVAILCWRRDGHPRIQGPRRKLLLGEAAKLPWSFYLPQQNGEPTDPRKCSFLEGGTLHGRLKARPSVLPDLGGYGASLSIVDDPYQIGGLVMEVSPCVLDGGVIGSVAWKEEDHAFHIKSRFTEIGPDHRLLIWYSEEDGPSCVKEIDRISLKVTEDGWRWLPGGRPKIHGLALIYRSVRLGSWFNGVNSSLTAIQRPPGTPAEVAALVRAWKAPILQEEGEHARRYAEWLREHWVTVLPVWLADGELRGPGELSWPAQPLAKSWKNAVADLLLAALPCPTPESARQIVEALSPGLPPLHAIGTSVWKLAEVCPILATRVANLFLSNFVSHAERHHFFEMLLASHELRVDEERAAEIAGIHGERDAFWLQQTVPAFHAIQTGGKSAVSHAYRLLSKSKDYRLYALGNWLRDIR